MEQQMSQATETFARLYRIFDALRTARPETYRADFARVFAALMEQSPEAANELVRELLGQRASL